MTSQDPAQVRAALYLISPCPNASHALFMHIFSSAKMTLEVWLIETAGCAVDSDQDHLRQVLPVDRKLSRGSGRR